MTDRTISRRQFLASVAAGVATAVVPSALLAQGQQQQKSAATNMVMDGDKYRVVRLPAKSGTPSMTEDARDELEHHLHCQCGCPLDIYTCRTTDFTCPVSPRMHHDVMALVQGGYSAQEILDAFVNVYGERVLMEPTKTGFNLTGYLAPFAALGGGAALVITLIRKWRPTPAEGTPVDTLPVDASADELARIEAAVRKGDE
jgi:cytochrome c-type biogenesis protein CcmH